MTDKKILLEFMDYLFMRAGKAIGYRKDVHIKYLTEIKSILSEVGSRKSDDDNDLVWKILKIGFKCGFESGEAEENRVRNKKARKEIRKLLQSRT